MNRFWKVLFLLCLPLAGFSQGFQKGNLVIDGGVGFGVYSADSNWPSSENEGAVNGIFRGAAEFGLANWLGVGFVLERNGFATEQDSNNAASSFNLQLAANLHVIKSNSNTLFLSLQGGYSQLTYEEFDTIVELSSPGSVVQVGLGFRHYFNRTLGFYLHANYAAYDYSNFEDSDGDILRIATTGENFAYSTSGANIGGGLSLKF